MPPHRFGPALLLILLTSCTPFGDGTQPAAVIAGRTVSRTDVNTYLTYTVRFYAWAHEAHLGGPAPQCTAKSRNATCKRLRQQILGRLIEEQIVEKYARGHGIHLSRPDELRVEGELHHLVPQHKPGSKFFSKVGINRTFVRGVLERQILVQKVEAVVLTKMAPLGEPAFLVRSFTIPVSDRRPTKVAYRQAEDLAIDGWPIPKGTKIKTRELFSRNLTVEMRDALDAAQAGQYAGPFPSKRAYIVLKLLDAPHDVSAGENSKAQVFRTWLREAIQKAHSRCYSEAGKAVRCPL